MATWVVLMPKYSWQSTCTHVTKYSQSYSYSLVLMISLWRMYTGTHASTLIPLYRADDSTKCQHKERWRCIYNYWMVGTRPSTWNYHQLRYHLLEEWKRSITNYPEWRRCDALDVSYNGPWNICYILYSGIKVPFSKHAKYYILFIWRQINPHILII